MSDRKGCATSRTQKPARCAVPVDGEVVAGSGGGDEEQGSVAADLVKVAGSVAVAPAFDCAAGDEAFGGAGDDQAAEFEAFEGAWCRRRRRLCFWGRWG